VHSSFDILKKNPDGSFLPVEAVNDLDSANTRIKDLIKISSGQNVVVEQRIHDVNPARSSRFRIDPRRE
jgi:hypothetical protein